MAHPHPEIPKVPLPPGMDHYKSDGGWGVGILRDARFFCTFKVGIFFSSLGVYVFWPESLGIFFLLIISWGKFFGGFFPTPPPPPLAPHHFL